MAQVPASSSSEGSRSRARSGSTAAASAERSDPYADNPVVKELRRLDDQHRMLELRFRAERRELEKGFQARLGAVLDRRRRRLAGTPTSPEVSYGPSGFATPAIKGFWKTVLQNSDEFREDIEEHDECILEYLGDIRAEDLDVTGAAGFRLVFSFAPNPYFSNTELAKVYHTERKSEFVDQLDCARIAAPAIAWKPGQNATVESVLRKKGSGKKKNKARREEVARPSFFRVFFRNLGPDEEIPEEEMDDLCDDEYEDDAHDLMCDLLDGDYRQALALRRSIVPHAIRWYTGAACDDDDDEDEEEEEEEEDAEEDDEERSDISMEDGAGSEVEGRRVVASRPAAKAAASADSRRSADGQRRGKGSGSAGSSEKPEKSVADCEQQ